MILLSYLSFQKIALAEDITEIFPSKGNIRTVSKILNESNLSKRIVFNIISREDSALDVYDLIHIGDELNDSLLKLKDKYSLNISYQQEDLAIDELFDFYLNNIPYYMQDEDYTYLDSILEEDVLKELFHRNREELISPAGIGLRQFIFKDPLHLITRPLKRLKNLQLDEQYSLEEGRIVSKNPMNLVLFIVPEIDETKTAINAQLFTEIDIILNAFKSKYPQIDFLYFSGSRVAAGNADQVKRDVFLTVGIAVIMLFLLIGTYLRNPMVVLKLFIPMLMAGLTSIIVLSYMKAEISIIAIGVGSILLGISIDYALHFYIHFSKNNSINQTLQALSPSILMSAITTAMAFLCLSIIDSTAINDLAIFASISIISSAIFTLIFLPHFLKKKSETKTRNHFIDRLASWRLEHNYMLVLTLIIISIAAIPFASKVQFNENLMDLNYMSDELKQTEQKLNEMNNFSQKNIFLISPGKNREEALSNFELVKSQLEQFVDSGQIDAYIDHGTILMSQEQEHKQLEKWKHYWQGKQEIIFDKVNRSSVEAGFNEAALQHFTNMIYAPFSSLNKDDIESFAEQAVGITSQTQMKGPTYLR